MRVEGNGVILLTGPSGCGKGEIGKALCRFLSIPESRHLSMGEILRTTVVKAKENNEFRHLLSEKYSISGDVSIFIENKNSIETIKKVKTYLNGVISFLGSDRSNISQLDWLEFCVANGLLIPDDWTEKIIDALFVDSPELCEGIFILDGYPRTVIAAEKLLGTFDKLGIDIIKILHLFISKEQMRARALLRKRMDDTQNSLDSRYQFYIDKVQPSIDYLKDNLGTDVVSLIDAHQPVFNELGELDINASIKEVVLSVMQSLGLPKYLVDVKCD